MPVSTITRQTALVARVIDDNLNSWEHWAGFDLNIDVAYSGTAVGVSEFEQAYWGYRGQASVCRIASGNIIRVRVGDGTNTDRQLYIQTITDPAIAAQWESWTLLYSGDHYAVFIEADASAGAGYYVYHAKTTGLYQDNSLKITRAGIVKIKGTAFTQGRLYYQAVSQDTDGGRRLDWYYTPNVRVGVPSTFADIANYRWFRSDVACLKANDTYYRFRAMAHENSARNREASQVLTIEGPVASSSTGTFGGPFNSYENVRFLKGPSAQAGYKIIENLFVTSMYAAPWAGAYYLFYNERHFDLDGVSLSNLKNPLFWSRSVGYPYRLSAPTPVGFSIWGFAGVFESGNYVYLCGNGRVLRRPRYEQIIDMTDYVLEGDYDIPRDNQKSTGILHCANPRNILGRQLGMSDAEQVALTEHRTEFALGQMGAGDGAWEWKQEAVWWLTRLRKTREGARQRLEVELSDFYYRLENKFRDSISMPGRTSWIDWGANGVNQLSNWTNSTDEFQSYNPTGANAGSVPRLKTIVSGGGPYGGTITLWGGWRGENGLVSAVLHQNGGIVFRYQDPENFYVGKFTSGQKLELIRYQGGVATVIQSLVVSAALPATVSADFRWGYVRLTVSTSASESAIELVLSGAAQFAGFVGTTSPEISNFVFWEPHAVLTTNELLRILLAYSDEHSVLLEIEDETAAAEHIDLLWGPQSDLNSPEKAFRQLIEAGRLQTTYKPGVGAAYEPGVGATDWFLDSGITLDDGRYLDEGV